MVMQHRNRGKKKTWSTTVCVCVLCFMESVGKWIDGRGKWETDSHKGEEIRYGRSRRAAAEWHTTQARSQALCLWQWDVWGDWLLLKKKNELREWSKGSSKWYIGCTAWDRNKPLLAALQYGNKHTLTLKTASVDVDSNDLDSCTATNFFMKPLRPWL